MSQIRIENLNKQFGNFVAVDGVTFEVGAGRVLGFLGPNGAGKTTTLRMMVGLSKPNSGKIFINDQEIVFGQSKNNKLFGYLPEQPAFYGWMTGTEYLNFIGELFGFDSKTIKHKIIDLLKLVDLIDAKNKKISTYSNGMKQRLGIAQALINDPEVLIMDEPVSALDPIGRREVLKIIENLKKDKTIILSTHILADVDRICDDVAIINHGKLIALSPLVELKEKYAQPILEVEFASDPHTIVSSLKAEPWQSNIEKNGNTLKISLKDEKSLTNNVPLKFFALRDIKVIRYGQILPEAEDLFISLIGKDKQ